MPDTLRMNKKCAYTDIFWFDCIFDIRNQNCGTLVTINCDFK